MELKPGLISVNIYLAGLTNNAETGGLSSSLGLYKYFITLSNCYLKLDIEEGKSFLGSLVCLTKGPNN